MRPLLRVPHFRRAAEAGLISALLAAAGPLRAQTMPVPVESPSPAYPPSALRAEAEGKVHVSVTVREDGTPDRPEVSRSSGVPALDEAALNAVRRWKFRPGTGADGKPVSVKVTVPVQFVLVDAPA